ncbi:MAG: ferrochelatase [Eggerthellales bacterium]|nr:ferrochelatase [Eggerthellales bacterium]
MTDNKRIGILLVGYGAPTDCSHLAIKKFCKEMLFDRGLMFGSRIVWWAKVRFGMLQEISDEYTKSLQTLWPQGDFPEWPALNTLCQQLELRLGGSEAVKVVPATCYGGHAIIDALRQLRSSNCGRVVVLPLFPQASYSTTGIVKQRVKSAQRHLHWNVPLRFVDDYHDNQAYVCALAASIEHAGFNAQRGDKLLLAYRSIPTDDIEKGDDYELQSGSTSLYIASELGLSRESWTMAFFAKPYDVRQYLGPYARDVAKRWGQYCDDRMFIVCPGYATECIRTQYYVKHTLKEIFAEYRELKGQPEELEQQFVYVPTLGKTRAHLKVLTNVLTPYLEEE